MGNKCLAFSQQCPWQTMAVHCPLGWSGAIFLALCQEGRQGNRLMPVMVVSGAEVGIGPSLSACSAPLIRRLASAMRWAHREVSRRPRFCSAAAAGRSVRVRVRWRAWHTRRAENDGMRSVPVGRSDCGRTLRLASYLTLTHAWEYHTA